MMIAVALDRIARADSMMNSRHAMAQRERGDLYVGGRMRHVPLFVRAKGSAKTPLLRFRNLRPFVRVSHEHSSTRPGNSIEASRDGSGT